MSLLHAGEGEDGNGEVKADKGEEMASEHPLTELERVFSGLASLLNAGRVEITYYPHAAFEDQKWEVRTTKWTLPSDVAEIKQGFGDSLQHCIAEALNG